MRTLIAIALLIAVSLADYGAPAAPAPAQYGGPAPAEHVEAAEPEHVEAAEPAPATCRLNPRSEAECTKLAKSKKNCEDCVTSNCKGCQKVFIKFCTHPERANSVEECLKRADKAECPGHTYEDCRNHARKGLAEQCAEQACQGGAAPANPPPRPAAPRDDRPRECPAKKPKKDIDVGAIPLPQNHLRGGRVIADKLRSLSKSLDLLTYTLRLKGVTVDAPCVGKAHEVNLDKFAFPKPAPVPVPAPTPVKKEDAPAPKYPLPTGGALAWIHAETKAEYPAGADATTVRKAEYTAATKDLDAILVKLNRVDLARQNVKVEYEAATTFGNISPAEKKEFENRQSHLEQLEGALKVLYAQAQQRKEKNG